MIDVLRKQQATWAESKAAAKADSRVTIDFVGSVDGEELKAVKQLISFYSWAKVV